MSSTLLLKGEETRNGHHRINVPMVQVAAVQHDHIPCAKPVDGFSTPRDETCKFDHMYTTLADSKSKVPSLKNDDKSQQKLKEMCLLQLQLISRQSEELIAKDKVIQELKQENETFRRRIERMTRRLQNQGSPSQVPSSDVQVSLPTCNVADNSTQTSGDFPKQEVTETVINHSVPIKAETPKVSVKTEATQSTPKVDEDRESTVNKLKRPASTSPFLSKNKKLKTSPKSVEKKASAPTPRRLLLKWAETEEEIQRFKEWIQEAHSQCRVKGTEKDLLLAEKAPVLLVNEEYSSPAWKFVVDDPCEIKKNDIEVPSWKRQKVFPAYTMEGTEDIEEDTIAKRHQKYEAAEKRRKRWDIQRLREENQKEKLQQRHKKPDQQNPKVCHKTLQPDPNDIRYITVCDEVPVPAMGGVIPNMPKTYMTIPKRLKKNTPDEKKLQNSKRKM